MPDSLLICRADADSTIGTGHVMRCIALANAWIKFGGEAVLIGSLPDGLKARVARSFSSVVSLNDSNNMALTRQAIQTTVGQRPYKSVWITLDGYRYNEYWQNSISDLGIPLLVIDDYAHLDFYHCDIILNQNAGAERFKYHTGKGTSLLLGTEYILLRDDLLMAGRYPKKPENMERILVTMGGVDSPNMTQTVLETLSSITNKDLSIRVLLGSGNPHIESVRFYTDTILQNTELIVQAENMSEHYQWATLAVSAAGTTSWELCYFGVPTLLIQIADNQMALAEHLAQTGTVKNIGWYEFIKPKTLLSEISKLINETEQRSKMSKKAQALVDGKGVLRVIREMERISSLRSSVKREVPELFL